MNRKRAVLIGLGASLLGLWAAPPVRAAEASDWENASLSAFEALAPADPSAGGDPRAWRAALATQAGQRHALEPGLDLVFTGDSGRVVALLRVAGPVATRGVTFTLPGAQGYAGDAHGHARLSLPDGDLAFLRPGAVRETQDGLRAVPAQWVDAGAGAIRLSFPGHSGKLPLLARFEVLFLSDPDTLARYDRNADGRIELFELTPPAVPDPNAPAATVSATMSDALTVDGGTPGQANPTDVIEYTVNVTAQGGTATGLAFSDTLDADTTPTGPIKVSPLALDDTYNAVGNLTLTKATVLEGLLGNDRDFLGDTSFAVTSPAPGVPTPTGGGGSITVNADGTFSYTPPTVGSTDTLNYTITDASGLSGSGTVTFNIAGRVWFVDRDAPGGGTGTQASPFNLLSAVNGAGGVGDPDGPNDIIYMHDRGAVTDYVGGIELEASQRLVGSGVPLIISGTTYLAATTPPVIENTAGNALTLIAGATVDGRPHVEGLTILAANNAAIAGTGVSGTVVLDNVTINTSAGGAGLSLTNHSGTLTLNGAINGSGSGAALVLNGGAGSVTLTSGAINKTGGRLVDVQNKTGGTVTFGSLSGTGAATDAIVAQNNTGGTALNFASGLSVTTTSGRGLFASNAGLINVAGTGSTISATGGAALDVSGTSFGAGATFASVSSTGSSAEGVKLSNVTGPVTINGGAISGSTGTAFSLAQGSANVTYAGTISKTNAGRAVDVQTRAGGTVTFSGAVTASGASTGINVSGATAASTTTFSGAVDLGSGASRLTGGTALTLNHGGNGSTTSFSDVEIFTNGQAGVDASNGGTFNVTTGRVDAQNGRALNADGLALGATFLGLVSSGSAGEGVRVNAASGSLTSVATTISSPSTQGLLVQGSTVSADFGTTQVSGTGTQRILVTGSSGNVTFAGTTLSGGTDGVSLQNNSAGTRTFASLNVSGNSGIGFLHAVGGGATSVTGTATITNPGGTGADIQNSASSVTFNGLTVNKGATSGTGVALTSNTVAPSFGTLAITTSNGTGLSSSNSGVVNSGGSIAATNGPAINASATAFSSTFATVSSTNSASQGINLSGPTGTLTMSGGAISGSAGTGFNVSGGGASVTYAGSVTQNNAQRIVDVQSTTGGSVSVATATGGASSTGVNINAANGNVSFTNLTHGTSGSRTANQAVTINGGTGTYGLGTVSIFTTGGTAKGISALNADGALNSTAGTVDAAGAPAIDIDGPAGLTTLGMTLTTVSANGGANGLLVRDTNGSFTVTGDGTNNASGGTLQATSGDGALLTNVTNMSFTSMRVQSIAAASGIRGTQVVNFTFNNGTMLNVGSDLSGSTDSAIAFKESVSFTENNVSGNVTVSGSTFTEPGTHALNITNWSGTVANLTVTNNTFGNLTSTAGGNAIHVATQGSAGSTAHVTTGTITGNVVNEWYVGSGVSITGGNSGSATPATLGAAGTPITISNNRFRNASPSTFGNAIAVAFNGQNGVSNFIITNNGTVADPLRRFGGLAVSAFFAGNVTGGAQIDGQVVTSFNTAGSSGIAIQADAVVGATDTPVVSATMNNNSVSNNDGNCVRGIARASAAVLNLKVQSNTVTAPVVTNRNGIRVDSGSTAGDTTLCLNLSGNTSAGSGVNAGLGVRKQGSVAATNEFRIHGLSPSPAAASQMQAYVTGQNPAGNGVDSISGTPYEICNLP